MTRFRDKRVFITGAAGGIGFGIAEAFLREGANVWLTDFRAQAVERALQIIEPDLRPKAHGGSMDVRQPDSVAASMEEAFSQLEGLDILVNCAGIYPSHPLLTMTEEDWDRVLDTNLKGPLLVSQAFARHLIDAGAAGHIVNITSGAAERARKGAAHYCTSKAGLSMLTRAFAIELAPYGFRVNAVSPGFIEVPGEVSPLSDEYVAAISSGIPLGRAGLPRDIAAAVLFCCSDEAEFMTGATIRMDGGSSAGNAMLPLSQPAPQ